MENLGNLIQNYVQLLTESWKILHQDTNESCVDLIEKESNNIQGQNKELNASLQEKPEIFTRYKQIENGLIKSGIEPIIKIRDGEENQDMSMKDKHYDKRYRRLKYDIKAVFTLFNRGRVW